MTWSTMLTSSLLLTLLLLETAMAGMKVRGKYIFREEIVREAAITHACRLTRTPVLIEFPGMRQEVLVNFIGYKEPDRIFVNRCKGLCSSNASGATACVPSRRSWLRVELRLQTRVLGKRSRRKVRQLLLEQHEECQCQCLETRRENCVNPAFFDNSTCICKDCANDRELRRRHRSLCKGHWHEESCSCANENEPEMANLVPEIEPLANRDEIREELNRPRTDFSSASDSCQDCLDCLSVQGGFEAIEKSKLPEDSGRNDAITTWLLIGYGLVIVFIFTTVFYWKKHRQVAQELELEVAVREAIKEDIRRYRLEQNNELQSRSLPRLREQSRSEQQQGLVVAESALREAQERRRRRRRRTKQLIEASVHNEEMAMVPVNEHKKRRSDGKQNDNNDTNISLSVL